MSGSKHTSLKSALPSLAEDTGKLWYYGCIGEDDLCAWSLPISSDLAEHFRSGTHDSVGGSCASANGADGICPFEKSLKDTVIGSLASDEDSIDDEVKQALWAKVRTVLRGEPEAVNSWKDYPCVISLAITKDHTFQSQFCWGGELVLSHRSEDNFEHLENGCAAEAVFDAGSREHEYWEE